MSNPSSCANQIPPRENKAAQLSVSACQGRVWAGNQGISSGYSVRALSLEKAPCGNVDGLPGAAAIWALRCPRLNLNRTSR